MRVRILGQTILGVVFFFCCVGSAAADDKTPIDVISDNSFLIEEAYNQEPARVDV
jgi:hypothetical protein